MMLPDFRKYILPSITQICAEACEILAEKAQNKEQTETGIRDHDIRKDGVGVLTAVAEDAHYAETV